MMKQERRVVCITFGITLMLAIMASPVTADTMTTLDCQNLPGSDYKSIAVTTRDECSAACLAETQCKAATFVHALNQPASCWMKNSVPAAQPAQCDMQLVMHSFVKNEIPSGSGSWGCTDPTGVKADFTASPTTGAAPLTVTFTDTSFGASKYTWLFGDGQSSTSPSPTHQYMTAGTYNVQLTIQTGCENQFNKYGTITVTQAQATIGYLSVTTSPSGATLYVDGTSQGTTPKSGITLTPGSHDVLISKTGYSDYPQTVTIEAGKTKELTVTLTSDQQPDTTGTITITSTPSGAAIYLDGVSKGMTPAKLSGISPNTYTLRLTKSGYKDFSGTVAVAAGKTTTVTATLNAITTATATTPAQPGTGSLSVVTNPAGAQVSIDGAMAGVSPTTIPGLSAGTHNLMLKMNGYQDLMTTVTITAGQTAEYNTALAKVKTPGFEAVFAISALCAVFLIGRKME